MSSAKIDRLFRVLPWLMVASLAVLFLGLLFHELRRQSQAWQQQLAAGAAAQEQLVAAAQINLTREAKLIAHLVAQDPVLIELIRTAAQTRLLNTPESAAQMNVLRAQVAERARVFWSELHDANGRQLTIFLAPDAVVFHRAHHPERFGDAAMSLRPLIMDAFTQGTALGGMELGRHGSGYRGVVPIPAGPDAGEPIIAVIEVGLSLLGADVSPGEGGQAVLLHPNALDKIMWIAPSQAAEKRRALMRGQWLLEDFDGEPVEAWAAAGMLPLPQNRVTAARLQWHGRHYLLQVTPMRDFLGEQQQGRQPQVALLTWRDISAEVAMKHATRRQIGLKWTVALVITLAALAILLRLTRRYVYYLAAEHHRDLAQEHEASEQARQQLTLALANSESGFWEWDVINNQATFSSQWRKICGIDDGAITLADAEEWFTRVHPTDQALCRRDIVRHLRGETEFYENEFRLRTETNSYRWLHARGKAVERRADGKVLRLVGVFTDITPRKEAEVTILRQQAALRAMNEIASLPAVDPQDQLRRALVLGSSYVGLPIGIVSQIQGNDYRIRVQISPDAMIQDDQVFSLDNCYCRTVLERGEVLAFNHRSDAPSGGHPCFQQLPLQSYIGVPLWVDGATYGTLNFSSATQRFHPFDDLDKDFMQLLGRWVGVTIERWQQLVNQQEILKKFRKLSERLPGFLYQFQLRPDGSYSFPYASAGLETICGVRLDQALTDADSVFAAVYPADLAELQESIHRSAEQLSLWSMSFRITHPKHGVLWVRGDAKPEKLPDGSVLWHGFLSDVTKEKSADIKRQAANALQQAILDAASVAIIATDRSGVIRVFNRGAEKMSGYSARELIGKLTPLKLHSHAELEGRAQELGRALSVPVTPDFNALVANTLDGKTEEREWTYVRKDGSDVPVLLTVSAMQDAEGRDTGYLFLARDITELKRIEQMKNEFVATVSHELRTPLTAISGSLSVINSKLFGELSVSMKKMLTIAQKNSERLNYLVNDLLDMEKLDAGKMHFDMRAHAIRPIIEHALETNSAYADQHQVQFVLDVAIDEEWVLVDAQRLEQVMANLLSNAAKFSSPGSRVTVRVSADDQQVIVCVSDTGMGIPVHYHAQIFQKFSQVDSSASRRKGGTGLGLAICKELIEKMGGSIRFESAPERGSDFYFMLPRLTQRLSHNRSLHESRTAE